MGSTGSTGSGAMGSEESGVGSTGSGASSSGGLEVGSGHHPYPTHFAIISNPFPGPLYISYAAYEAADVHRH